MFWKKSKKGMEMEEVVKILIVVVVIVIMVVAAVFLLKEKSFGEGGILAAIKNALRGGKA